MIEALIASALVLVPLFLAIPVIAKYQDIKSYTVQAARYAAWERTVWFGGDAAAKIGFGSSPTFTNQWDANAKPDNQIRVEIGTRLLSESSAAFSSTADKAAGSYVGGPKQLWRDRRGQTLLTNYGDLAAKFDNNTAPGLINDLLSPLMTIAAVVSSFTVDTKANYTATVGLAVQQVAFNPEAGLGGCAGCPVDFIATGSTASFTEKNVLVANGWSANGPGSPGDNYDHPEKMTVYNQVRGLTPTSILKPTGGVFKTVMDVLNAVALVFLPELSTLDLGRIEVDKVPADRLR